MQTKGDKKTRLIADTVLIVLLLAVGLSALFITRSLSERGKAAVVTVNGEIVGEYQLDRNGRYELNGGTNVLVIQDGCAFIDYADCPDKTCKKTGRISDTGQKIVCLPNKVMVEIK